MKADSCTKLYNELNFERRQAYICYRRFECPKHLYETIDRLCNAQQIIKKNNAMINNFWSFSYIIRR
ncbi:MAG: hypothetical protein LM574_06280, partial [Archaeoglobus sp.]|nr:hypothetical protein [Archaeoglobus sp.]